MRRRFPGILAAGSSLLAAAHALAAPTQEEVFQSINQNVGSTVDISKYIPWILAAIAVVIMAAVYNQRKSRPTSAKRLHHAGKLLREIRRAIKLKSSEMKQLKLLADEQKVESPLTLLLCPSVLAKSLRSRNPKVDRLILEQIIRRMRGGE
jgi:hypothetical protein